MAPCFTTVLYYNVIVLILWTLHQNMRNCQDFIDWFSCLGFHIVLLKNQMWKLLNQWLSHFLNKQGEFKDRQFMLKLYKSLYSSEIEKQNFLSNYPDDIYVQQTRCLCFSKEKTNTFHKVMCTHSSSYTHITRKTRHMSVFSPTCGLWT